MKSIDLLVGVVFCMVGTMLVIFNRGRTGELARGQRWVGRGMIVAGVLLPLLLMFFAKE